MDQERLGMIDLKQFLKVFTKAIKEKLTSIESDNFDWAYEVIEKIH